jgi:DnaJ-domain-containing protein 1
MTALDVVVIVAGLLFGYRLVSNYLSPNTDDGRTRTRSQADPQRGRPEGREWERHWESSAPKAPAWFEVLDVPENAELTDIERAYRAKISQYHPDKVAQLGEDIRQLAEAKSKEINAAYETARRLRRAG